MRVPDASRFLELERSDLGLPDGVDVGRERFHRATGPFGRGSAPLRGAGHVRSRAIERSGGARVGGAILGTLLGELPCTSRVPEERVARGELEQDRAPRVRILRVLLAQESLEDLARLLPRRQRSACDLV